MNGWVEWLKQHKALDAAGLFAMIIVGLVGVLRPVLIIGWVQSAYPDRDVGRAQSTVLLTRGIGAFLILLSIYAWARLAP